MRISKMGNSGQSWSLKSSMLLSRKGSTEDQEMYSLFGPFVENFVLERLSLENPYSSNIVIFDLVPHIKFRHAIELLSMQPITSTPTAWKRCPMCSCYITHVLWC